MTQDNEPWYLAGFGSHALSIPAGGSASTRVCFGLTYPAVRFFAAGDGGDATIHVRVVSRSLLGVLSVLDGGTFTAGSTWRPSPKLSTLLSALGAPLGSKTMTLQFTVERGTAQIDDLYVDPFREALGEQRSGRRIRLRSVEPLNVWDYERARRRAARARARTATTPAARTTS